jgi:alpha-L-fucosidase 2
MMAVAVAAALLLAAPAIGHAQENAAPDGAPRGTLMNHNLLWYRQPAAEWIEALPVGNGRLGAMVFGKATGEERVQLNENTLWDGHARDTNNPDALKHLPEVRRLLFAGKNAEATALAEKHLMGNPARIKSYQTLGDLFLDAGNVDADVREYRRELDLDTGVVRVTYRIGDATYTREVFASHPDQVIVMRFTCDQPGKIDLTARLTRGEVNNPEAAKGWLANAYQANQRVERRAEAPDRLVLRGQIEDRPEGSSESVGMRFEAQLRAAATGGTVAAEGERLTVHGADALTLVLSAGTSYRNGKPEERARDDGESAAKKPYDALRAAHVADHQKLFRRVALDLGQPAEEVAALPTDERLKAVQDGADDPGLAALYFQFGRYLLIGSSRKGGLPANLQGLWNEFMNAPWNSGLPHQHQPADELLAGRGRQPVRVPRPAPRLHRVARGAGHENGAGPLRRARLGGPPHQRHLGLHHARRRRVRDLADGSGLARPASVGALSVHRRHRLPARAGAIR